MKGNKVMFRSSLKWLFGPFVLLTLGALIVFIGNTSGLSGSEKRGAEESQKAEKQFNPDRQREISTETDRLAVSLLRTEPCDDCLGTKTFTFVVKNKLQGRTINATIRDATAQVDEVLIAGLTRAVVFGSIDGTLRSVNIIDAESGTIVDSFPCFFPTLSRNGRFLAFVKASPKFALPEQSSYVYLVYDLMAPPAQNRRAENSTDAGGVEGASVGTPVYPVENLAKKRYVTEITDERSAHALASDGLFWIDGTTLAFVDRSKKVNDLVLVSLDSGVDKVKLTVRRLDTWRIVRSCAESVSAPENLINVTNVSLSGSEQKVVHISLEPVGRCLRQSGLDIAIP